MIRYTARLILAALGFVLLGWQSIYGAPSSDEPVLLRQPDGRTFMARAWGDEWLNGMETADGYTILPDAAGRWVYASRDARGELTPSGLVVGRDSPTGISRRLRPQPGGRQPFGAPGNLAPGVQPAPPTAGTQRLLVIVVDFTPTASKGSTEAEWEQHYFLGGGTYTPTSVKNYWDTVSYGAITIVPAQESYGTANNGIVFVTLGTAHPNCGNTVNDCNRNITRSAIIASDGFVNYALFDDNSDGYLSTDELHLYIVVRGYENAFGGASGCTDVGKVAGHRWSLGFGSVAAPTVDGKIVGHWQGAPVAGPYQGGYMQEGEWHCAGSHNPGHKATIGISSHEIGHDLGTGAPDLYDTSSAGTNSAGIGDWGLQGSGSWNSVPIASGTHSGSHPAFPDPWSRWFFAFITPTAITGATLGVSLPQIETATGANRGVYYAPNATVTHWEDCVGGTGEYFLIENRQQVGFDAGLPGTGVLIWHIYEALNTCAPNGDEGTSPPGNPRLVVLEQADGLFGLECYSGGQCNDGDAGDPWPGSTSKTTFSDGTTPNSRYYSGASSGVCVWMISASSSTMTANMSNSNCGTAAVFRVERATGTVSADGSYNCGLTSGSCFNTGTPADIAEYIDVSEPVEPGDVVEVDSQRPGFYRKARSARSLTVAGVISTAPGITFGHRARDTLQVDLRHVRFDSSVRLSMLHLPANTTMTLNLQSIGSDGGAVQLTWAQAFPLSRIADWLPRRTSAAGPYLALMGRVPVKVTAENGPIQPGDLLISASTPGYAMRCSAAAQCEGAIIGKALSSLRQGEGIIEMLVVR